MSKKEVFLKWIPILWYIQLGVLAWEILSWFPFPTILLEWGSKMLSLVTAVVLFQLVPVYKRYRTAGIFVCVAIALSLVNMFVQSTMVQLGASACALAALYFEFTAHAELVRECVPKLAKSWNVLFEWEIICGVVVGIIGAPLAVVVAVMLAMDPNIVASGVMVLMAGGGIVLQIVYLILLKRTQAAYKNEVVY